MIWRTLIVSLLLIVIHSLPVVASESRMITDMAGRQVEIPCVVDKVLCSGPGCLRYLTYLQGQELVVGVDSIEKRQSDFDVRPYALANPHFKNKPLFGEFRGFDNPELILGLNPQPQVIFKTFKNMGHNPDELQAKTGIPVICLEYGNLDVERELIRDSLFLMGDVIDRKQRANDVCDFFENTIADLALRTADIPQEEKRTCYVGGVAKKGPHGLQSTEPAYPPFRFVNANNLACPIGGEKKPLLHATVSKEQVIAWNPEVIFIDIATTQLGKNNGALHELRTDPVYHELAAAQEDNIYTVLPYNWYANNYGSILANAFYVGKVLYPDRFSDVDPYQKTDEIYTFLVGKPVLSHMNASVGHTIFKNIQLR